MNILDIKNMNNFFNEYAGFKKVNIRFEWIFWIFEEKKMNICFEWIFWIFMIWIIFWTNILVIVCPRQKWLLPNVSNSSEIIHEKMNFQNGSARATDRSISLMYQKSGRPLTSWLMTNTGLHSFAICCMSLHQACPGTRVSWTRTHSPPRARWTGTCWPPRCSATTSSPGPRCQHLLRHFNCNAYTLHSCCSDFDNMPISNPQKYRMLIVRLEY